MKLALIKVDVSAALRATRYSSIVGGALDMSISYNVRRRSG